MKREGVSIGAPVTFRAFDVRAILEGRKTQTRRVVKNLEIRGPHSNGLFDVYRKYGPGAGWCAAFKPGESAGSGAVTLCPFGYVGDPLWVQEALLTRPVTDGTFHVRYAADDVPVDLTRCGDVRPVFNPLRVGVPSIYMPHWASRIELKIVSVRVERLQDISEADAIAEGVARIPDTELVCHCGSHLASHSFGDGHSFTPMPEHRYEFSKLWDDGNSRRAPWASNPWVFAIEFRRTKP